MTVLWHYPCPLASNGHPRSAKGPPQTTANGRDETLGMPVSPDGEECAVIPQPPVVFMLIEPLR